MTIRWSDEMLDTLRDMRKRGASVQKCADALGVCYATARAKLDHTGFGFARRHDRPACPACNGKGYSTAMCWNPRKQPDPYSIRLPCACCGGSGNSQ